MKKSKKCTGEFSSAPLLYLKNCHLKKERKKKRVAAVAARQAVLKVDFIWGKKWIFSCACKALKQFLVQLKNCKNK